MTFLKTKPRTLEVDHKNSVGGNVDKVFNVNASC